MRDGDHVGENSRGTGGAELLGGVGAGGDAVTGEAGVLGGGDVVGRVADQACRGGVGAECLERVDGEFTVGFEPRSVHRAKCAGEQMRDAQVVHQRARGGAVFVGEYGAADVLRVEGFEEFARAGEEGDAVEHVLGPVGAVNGQGLLDERGVGVAEEALDGDLESAADGAVNVFHARWGQAEVAERVAVGLMDRREMVEQGAIEVEEDGAKTSHAGNIGGWRATEQGNF